QDPAFSCARPLPGRSCRLRDPILASDIHRIRPGCSRPRVTDVLCTEDRGQIAELPIAQPDLTTLTAKTIAFGNDPARSSIHNKGVVILVQIDRAVITTKVHW